MFPLWWLSVEGLSFTPVLLSIMIFIRYSFVLYFALTCNHWIYNNILIFEPREGFLEVRKIRRFHAVQSHVNFQYCDRNKHFESVCEENNVTLTQRFCLQTFLSQESVLNLLSTQYLANLSGPQYGQEPMFSPQCWQTLLVVHILILNVSCERHSLFKEYLEIVHASHVNENFLTFVVDKVFL